MTRQQAIAIVSSILASHSKLLPRIHTLSNGELAITIEWHKELIYLWDHEEWVWFRDNYATPIPYYSILSRRGKRNPDKLKSAQLELEAAAS